MSDYKEPADGWDNNQAFSEGWGLFDVDTDACIYTDLQRLDDAGVFESDNQAVLFVKEQAHRGSRYHQRALELNGLSTPYSTEEPE